MSILRQDPTTKDWVIIATDRGKRPDDFQKTLAESALSTHDPACEVFQSKWTVEKESHVNICDLRDQQCFPCVHKQSSFIFSCHTTIVPRAMLGVSPC